LVISSIADGRLPVRALYAIVNVCKLARSVSCDGKDPMNALKRRFRISRLGATSMPSTEEIPVASRSNSVILLAYWIPVKSTPFNGFEYNDRDFRLGIA
jgi:hypothetical protein